MPWWPLIKDAVIVVKDVVLTAVGLILIMRQAPLPHPSYAILSVGVVLTGGNASLKVRRLLTAHFDGRQSSPDSASEDSPEVSPSSPSEVATGE